MSAVVHGGAPRGWLEFSANLAPHGTPPAVREAVRLATYGAYADVDPAEAERHLANDAGVDPASVLLVAGASEALRLVADAFVEPGAAAIALGPTYGEYERLVALRGATWHEIRAESPSFAPPVAEWARALETARYAVAFVCDPNNPTAVPCGLDAIASVPPSTHLVIDQSFAPFAAGATPLEALLARPNTIVVRSLTKRLAVPGLRVGYVVAAPAVLDRLRAVRDPWPVSAHACAAAAVARWRLEASERGDLIAWRDALVSDLRDLGLVVTPSDAPFVLAQIGGRAERVVRELAERRIAVRWCDSFGLPEHVRLAVRPPDEQRHLLSALRATLAPVTP